MHACMHTYIHTYMHTYTHTHDNSLCVSILCPLRHVRALRYKERSAAAARCEAKEQPRQSQQKERSTAVAHSRMARYDLSKALHTECRYSILGR